MNPTGGGGNEYNSYNNGYNKNNGMNKGIPQYNNGMNKMGGPQQQPKPLHQQQQQMQQKMPGGGQNPQLQAMKAKKPGEGLHKPHWDLSTLPAFQKDFYMATPEVLNRFVS
jgi:hypothetical protein